MCRQAKELQEKWEPKEGDWFHDGHLIRNIGDCYYAGYRKRYGMGLFGKIIGEGHEIYEYTIGDDNGSLIETIITWLPRIDQLAVLYDSDWSRFCNMCEFIDSHNVVSFEHAGLMAIMGRQYKKEWNGEDWI